MKYLYPHDYNSVENFDTLKFKNIVAKPVDARTYNGSQLISGTQTKYNNFGQPTDSYNFESPLNDIPFSASNPYTFQHKQTITYNATDKKPVKVSLDDNLKTYYIWAYNKQYPVAKIVSPVNTTISISVNDNNLSKSNVLSSIKNDVTYLKGLLSSYLSNSNYLVTIYTYKPLVGMTSVTDPAGVTTYYQYDNFGRLEYIKNDDEKLEKKHGYHYAGQ